MPPHHVWLQGDNTRNSNDSRHYGAMPVAMLRGRVCYRVWPLSEVGPIRAQPERCRVVTPGATPLDAPRGGGGSLAGRAGGAAPSPVPFAAWGAVEDARAEERAAAARRTAR